MSNKLDGTEDDMVWDDDDNIPLSEFQSQVEEVNDDLYNDLIIMGDWEDLFEGDSDSDAADIEGFYKC